MGKMRREMFDKNVQIVDYKKMEIPKPEETGLTGIKNLNRLADARTSYYKEREQLAHQSRYNQGNASEDMWKQQCEKECRENPGLKNQIIQKYVKKGR